MAQKITGEVQETFMELYLKTFQLLLLGMISNKKSMVFSNFLVTVFLIKNSIKKLYISQGKKFKRPSIFVHIWNQIAKIIDESRNK